MLSIKNVSKSYGEKKILNNVSLEVPAGTIAVLLGASGVGKSTLLRVLNNLESIDGGTVTLNGTQLDMRPGHKNLNVGMVFQQFNLFDHLTVQENITLPLEKVLSMSATEAQQRAQTLLAQYGLADKALKRVSELSGGQKQRLAIARTIALKPHVVCLDEPTSALDPLLTSHVAQSIEQLAQQGFMVLVATHDTALLEKLPCTIYLMEHGSVVESADAQSFKESPNSYPNIKGFVAGDGPVR